MTGFAIIPDNGMKAKAIFTDLEDALDWALRHLGPNRFTIRHVALVTLTLEEEAAERLAS